MPVLTDYEVPSEIKRRVKITVNSIHGQYQKQSNIVSNVKEIIMKLRHLSLNIFIIFINILYIIIHYFFIIF